MRVVSVCLYVVRCVDNDGLWSVINDWNHTIGQLSIYTCSQSHEQEYTWGRGKKESVSMTSLLQLLGATHSISYVTVPWQRSVTMTFVLVAWWLVCLSGRKGFIILLNMHKWVLHNNVGPPSKANVNKLNGTERRVWEYGEKWWKCQC